MHKQLFLWIFLLSLSVIKVKQYTEPYIHMIRLFRSNCKLIFGILFTIYYTINYVDSTWIDKNWRTRKYNNK